MSFLVEFIKSFYKVLTISIKHDIIRLSLRGEFMDTNFIPKFETENFFIGSFDSHFYENIELMEKDYINKNYKIKKDSKKAMENMPKSYRATITDKKGNYIGYIGLYDVNYQEQKASLKFETKISLTMEDIDEILNTFNDWLVKSLNITNIEEYAYFSNNRIEIKRNEIIPKRNIIIPSNLLVAGIKNSILEEYKSNYDIPKLQLACTIKSSDRVIGIIGLSNVIWSNKRANLNIFLDKKLGEDIINELSEYVINDYLNYVHSSNIHNVTFNVSGSDEAMKDILKETNMSFYASIPYASIKDDMVESKLMYQHIPYMIKRKDIYIPENTPININDTYTNKKELSNEIQIDNNYRLVSPKVFKEKEIETNKVFNGHVTAMRNRQGYTVPIGEDKYILNKESLLTDFMNYSYILLDNDNNYSGYINVLRSNANDKNAEIEIGIVPDIRNKGLGTNIINKFYDELFSIGYLSVTSVVFSFNNPSLRLHEKVAEFNGVRLDSYYINGKLWNMNYYSKVKNK